MDADKLGGPNPVFDRYEIFSPNVFTDPQYRDLIRYVETHTNQKRDDCCHTTFDQQFIRQKETGATTGEASCRTSGKTAGETASLDFRRGSFLGGKGDSYRTPELQE